MTKVTPENEAEAHAAGVAAAKAGQTCVPASCDTYRALITDFQVGDGAAHLAWRWIQGHRAASGEPITDAAA